jgi:ankyrin repeat protein
MKKQLLFLTLLTGSSLMYAAAAAPTQKQRAQAEQELRHAASWGNAQGIKRLLKVPGININAPDKDGNTALILAVKDKNEDIVQELLNTKGIEVNAANNMGYTALMYAAHAGRKELVEMLLKAGADKTMVNKGGETAEQIASDWHEDIANYIKDYQPSGQFTKSAKKR